MPALLEFDRASVCLGQKTVLDSVSFRIEEGEHVAILGPNGSGKSTLIKTITRVIMIKDGRIFRDGEKEDLLTSKSLSELFGMDVKVAERHGYYHLFA